MSNNLVVLRDGIAESGFVTAEVYLSPLPGTEPIRVKARIGSLVRDILPKEARAPMVCIIDGIPLKREWWMQRPVCEGDRIQFAPIYLGGKDNSTSILAAVAMIALYVVAPYIASAIAPGLSTASWGYQLLVNGIILLGTALISAILPNPASERQTTDGERPSSVYNVDTSGNNARIFSPIPVQYGRMKYYPNYAAQPYAHYWRAKPTYPQGAVNVPLESDSTGDADYRFGVQYYYALFCLGQGEYDIEAINIADSPLSSFKDVLVARILQPGEMPQYVSGNVVTNDAVSGLNMDDGSFIGPFVSCSPGRKITQASFDFVFPRGLGVVNDAGATQGLAVNWQIYAQPINNSGNATGNWSVVANCSLSEATSTPLRMTTHVNLAAGRYRFQVIRQGASDKNNSRVFDSIQWAALRCTLAEQAPLCKTATHFELVLRASEQLSQLSQRKISIIATRKVGSWDDPTPTPTRSPARALWDKWTNTVYGDALPRDRIDIDMLRKYDALAAERLDRFDYVFENRVSSQEADQLIAKVMRCVALQRQGVKTIVRDELVDMPLTLFNPTNTAEKSVTMDYVQITEETADGTIIEYFSDVTWDWEEVECPGPGRTFSNTSHPMYNPKYPVMQNPTRVTLNGVTNRNHAAREGLYYSYTNALRRQFITWTTELQGALLYYSAPVLLATTLYNAQQGGEVRDWNPANRQMQLTNGIVDGKLVFMRHDSTLTEPIAFTVVDNATHTVQLEKTPDFPINCGSATSERTKYVIVSGELIRRIVKILAITPKGLGQTGAPIYELKGVVDVPEVHTVDETFLVPDTPEDYPGDFPNPNPPPPPPPPTTVRLGNFRMTRPATDGMGRPETTKDLPSITFAPNGAIYYRAIGSRDEWGIFDPAGVCTGDYDFWVKGPLVENIGSGYEIGFGYVGADGLPRSDVTWHHLKDGYTYVLEPPEDIYTFNMSSSTTIQNVWIRDVETHTIQARGLLETTIYGFQTQMP